MTTTSLAAGSVLIALLLCACSQTPAPKPVADTGVAAAPALLDIAGITALPEDVPSESRLLIARARRMVRKQQSAEAVELLSTLLLAQPDYSEARYELAIAASKAGNFSLASTQLRTLLLADFYQWNDRIAEDGELSEFRDSVPGAEIAALRSQVEHVWSWAMERGVPAILWSGEAGTPVAVDALRSGFFLPGVERFYPIAPPSGGAAAALVDPVSGRTVVITAKIDNCKTDFCPRITEAGVELYSIPPRDGPRAWWTHETASGPGSVEVELTADGARVRVGDCEQTGCKTDWHRLEIGRGLLESEPVPTAGPTLRLDTRGSVASYRAPLLELKDDRTAIESVEFPGLPAPASTADFHTYALDHRGTVALVASNVDRCACDDDSGEEFTHRVTLLRRSGPTQVVAEGPGSATVRRGGDGAVYLQRGAEVVMWPAISAVTDTPPTRLPGGVLLVIPRSPNPNCCGL